MAIHTYQLELSGNSQLSVIVILSNAMAFQVQRRGERGSRQFSFSMKVRSLGPLMSSLVSSDQGAVEAPSIQYHSQAGSGRATGPPLRDGQRERLGGTRMGREVGGDLLPVRRPTRHHRILYGYFLRALFDRIPFRPAAKYLQESDLRA